MVVQVRLFPDAAQQAALRATLDLCNDAANVASTQAYQRRVFAKQSLQRLTYGQLKDMGLSAQPAIHVARKVAGAYATLRANITAGNLGPTGSKRRQAAEGKPIQFRPDAAQPYDDRCLSWRLAERTVSIWTVTGGSGPIPFGCSDQQHALLVAHRRGESDLICRDGKWFLYATCDIPDAPTKEPDGFLGVDLGVRRRREPAEPVARFLERAAGLGDKLGLALLQLPPTLAADCELLDAVLAWFPAQVRVAVEPRHASWWSDQTRAVLERRGAAALRSWLGRIVEAYGDDPPVHVYFNNDPGYAAVADAVAFATLARRRGLAVTHTPQAYG